MKRMPLESARARRALASVSAALVVLSISCSKPEGAPGETNDELGSATIAITSVPDEVGCIRIEVVGRRSTERNFDVRPGQSSELKLNGLPSGDVSFFGSAFPTGCEQVVPGQVAAWVGGPVLAKLIPGILGHVMLPLRQNTSSVVSVDFEIDPNTGLPCVGNTPGCIDPNDAVGPASGPAPDGARMISAYEAGAMLQAGTLVLSSQRRELLTEEERKKEDEANRAFVRQALANNPELLAALEKEPEEDENLRKLPDGNYLLRSFDNTGKELSVVTMGSWFSWGELANSLRRFQTRENQFNVYETLYNTLPPAYVSRRQLPSPKELGQFGGSELYNLNISIVEDWDSIRDLIGPINPIPGKPATCNGELGAPATMTDQVGGSCTPSPTSIYGATSFALKPYTTCVKNQANRGTCVSFGISGAIETAVAVKKSQWMNLSEQRLYYWAKVPAAFGDGLWTSGVMDNMISTSFRFPYESGWDYNPSQFRGSAGSTYVNSCVGYSGEHCSDTSHQGDRICFEIFGLRFCGWNGTAVAASGIGMTHVFHLWPAMTPSTASAWGRLMLALKIPLVISTDVTPSFDNAAGNGVATYLGNSETSRGGHAMAVMGFVDNERRPAGIPEGAGGGYFIVKNSWGSCWKDGGYIYLPYSWIHRYTWALSGVTGIN